MKRIVLCLFFVVVFACLSVGNLPAAQVAAPTNTTLDVLQTMTAGGIANAVFSQDKLFWNFVYTPTGSAGAANMVSANLIFQTQAGLDIHGWNFSSSNWAQGIAGPAEFTLGYTTEVCPPGSACFAAVTAGTTITAADAVYAPVSTFLPGPEVVSWSNGSQVTLTSGSPGPLPPGGNIGFNGVGPISVSAHFLGTGAITQTTLRFYETRAAVPEPGTLLLLGAGLLGLGIAARRRVKK